MLEYDRSDVSKRISVNKADGLRECIIFHYWYFLDINSRLIHKYVMVIII